MTRQEIEAEFDRFFEFNTADRSTVTSVSCRLFAEHIAAIVREKLTPPPPNPIIPPSTHGRHP